jgi:THO complex subunit 4
MYHILTSWLTKGLFSKIGPVQNLRLKYDKMGRSDGVAFVTYLSMTDAKEAIAKFDGAKAAGQPITVTLDTEGPPRRHETRPRDRAFRAPPRVGGRMASSGGRGRGPPGERRERRPPRTQDDLDKELDDFMNAPPPAANGASEDIGEEMAVD